ncbi:conserved hypothetical protein [Bosea sp. 62]|uniref:DUF3306 domain-containing protein n=1 Tax=unclassified Bosea (in: a-proteobacteria) TaxID=2653178 RepID=UPI0012520B9C|nr:MULTISPECIES: DUF3306 domain-containing protein [unclassified Bosea (in: a-proteobacteria)]CAD5294659.1 conserved hypothetical protein [Bosea sp. 7B]CAD5297720.1 conserved hypothetical protein [Bosea sp. 21B]CAD5297961.1 conserved hypothetical protein [Bosea sp. 46]VVT61337.1 conserved hypothetical protein [Bosea sp. EC-HK365B]VXB19218.1 conserved hypothetical protein [Bosea sp. 127]
MSRPDDEDQGEGFLGRWARRKKEAQQPAVPVVTESPVQPVVSADPAAPAPEPEMVEPPSLDLVDKDFDLAHWLKQNVPEEWKLKALRRAWESDPMISSYLDPARDYALDWNTPGGAPGYGPLSESDNVEEMLANIFGKPPEPVADPTEAVRNDVAVVRPSSNDESGSDSAAAQQGLATAADDPQPVRLSDEGVSRKSTENAAETGGSSGGNSVAAQKTPEIPPSQQRSRRRGGGATPL